MKHPVIHGTDRNACGGLAAYWINTDAPIVGDGFSTNNFQNVDGTYPQPNTPFVCHTCGGRIEYLSVSDVKME